MSHTLGVAMPAVRTCNECVCVSNLCLVSYNYVLYVQVTNRIHGLRFYHNAAAFSLGPGLIEVVIFGGLDDNRSSLAKTIVLRFGESV